MSNTNGDYISREKALAAFETVEHRYDPEWGNKRYAPDDVEEIINDVSAADVRPVVRGNWIMHLSELFPEDSTMECDQCHEEQPLTCDDNFCPNCGADMREVQTNAT